MESIMKSQKGIRVVHDVKQEWSDYPHYHQIISFEKFVAEITSVEEATAHMSTTCTAKELST